MIFQKKSGNFGFRKLWYYHSRIIILYIVPMVYLDNDLVINIKAKTKDKHGSARQSKLFISKYLKTSGFNPIIFGLF